MTITPCHLIPPSYQLLPHQALVALLCAMPTPPHLTSPGCVAQLLKHLLPPKPQPKPYQLNSLNIDRGHQMLPPPLTKKWQPSCQIFQNQKPNYLTTIYLWDSHNAALVQVLNQSDSVPCATALTLLPLTVVALRLVN